MEFTGLSARHEFDEKTQLHLPNLGEPADTHESKQTVLVKDTKPAAKTNEEEELPGGLAEIIRDLTRRPSS